jgi:hypothetical protein
MSKDMDINQATSMVKDYLSKSETEMNNHGSALPNYENPNIKLAILDDSTEEHEFGWVFFYNSVKFIESGNFRDALGGNAPLIIDRTLGELIETGTARETEYYVRNYIKNGDPNVES